MKKYSYIGIASIVLIFGIWAVNEYGNRKNIPQLETFEKVPAFSLTNQEGNTITNNDYKEKIYIVSFFFTSCPTICPKMNANLLKIKQHFALRPDIGIASITIDPKRDTPEHLKKHAQEKGFNKDNWHFLTGDLETIMALSNKGFKLYAGGFEHSGLFALVDKKGHIRSRIVAGNPIKYYDGLKTASIQMLQQDIKTLLQEK